MQEEREGLLGFDGNPITSPMSRLSAMPERDRSLTGLGKMYDKRFGSGKQLQLSMNIDMKDEQLLRNIIQENTDETIRRKLIEKYTKYYRHWKDFNILIAVLALLGIILGLYQWESEFY